MVIDLIKTRYGEFFTFGNETVANCLRNGDYWDQHLIPIFDEYVKKDSVVVEVGSNLGFHTVNLSKRAAKVYAFEPQRVLFYQLCANLFVNCCWNAYAFNEIVSNTEGNYIVPETLNNAGREIFAATFSMTPAETGKKSVLLDKIINDDVDFIKIDAQGADLAVLQGATNLIDSFRPIICFEYEQHLSLDLYNHTWESYERYFDINKYKLIDLGNKTDYLALPK